MVWAAGGGPHRPAPCFVRPARPQPRPEGGLGDTHGQVSDGEVRKGLDTRSAISAAAASVKVMATTPSTTLPGHLGTVVPIRVALPARADAPGHDPRHQEGGLAGPGTGLDDQRPIELGLSQGSGFLVGRQGEVTIVHHVPPPIRSIDAEPPQGPGRSRRPRSGFRPPRQPAGDALAIALVQPEQACATGR